MAYQVSPRYVQKGWGYELIFADTLTYCGKILHFETGKRTSMHFHAIKDETFYVLSGKFEICIKDTKDASDQIITLNIGDALEVHKLTPHQICAIDGGDIIEASTRDMGSDSYRVEKGSSQEVQVRIPQNKIP